VQSFAQIKVRKRLRKLKDSF